jgi:tetratricopeptide (TPR) repeat protein
LKNKANELFKEKKQEEAARTYLSAITTIRLADQIKKTTIGLDLESMCRNNLAMCQLNLNKYDNCVEQCEKVLEREPANNKA